MTRSDPNDAGIRAGEYAVCQRAGRWLVVRYTTSGDWLAVADCRTAEIAIAVALDLERALNPQALH